MAASGNRIRSAFSGSGTVETVACPRCGSARVKRIKVIVGYTLICVRPVAVDLSPEQRSAPGLLPGIGKHRGGALFHGLRRPGALATKIQMPPMRRKIQDSLKPGLRVFGNFSQELYTLKENRRAGRLVVSVGPAVVMREIHGLTSLDRSLGRLLALSANSGCASPVMTGAR